MIQKLSAPVSVSLLYDHHCRKFIPQKVLWEGKVYEISKIGMHHTFRQGRILFHVFSVESFTLFFRLHFNTESLQWTVEEIADGDVN